MPGTDSGVVLGIKFAWSCRRCNPSFMVYSVDRMTLMKRLWKATLMDFSHRQQTGCQFLESYFTITECFPET